MLGDEGLPACRGARSESCTTLDGAAAMHPSHLQSFDDIARNDRDFAAFQAGIGGPFAPSRRAARKLVELSRCATVLDFGCGPGVFAQTCTAAPMFGFDAPAEFALTGYDSAPAMLSRARVAHPAGRWLDELPTGEQWEAVVARHVLEHCGESWRDTLAVILTRAQKLAVIALSAPLNNRSRLMVHDDYLGARRWSIPRSELVPMIVGHGFAVPIGSPPGTTVAGETLLALSRT